MPQTETGSILITGLPGAWAMKPGCATLPFFGVHPMLVDDKVTEPCFLKPCKCECCPQAMRPACPLRLSASQQQHLHQWVVLRPCVQWPLVNEVHPLHAELIVRFMVVNKAW